MPLNQTETANWTRHVIENGQCTICGLMIPTMHKGEIWVRPSGMRSSVEPMGQWKECA